MTSSMPGVPSEQALQHRAASLHVGNLSVALPGLECFMLSALHACR